MKNSIIIWSEFSDEMVKINTFRKHINALNGTKGLHNSRIKNYNG